MSRRVKRQICVREKLAAGAITETVTGEEGAQIVVL
jgi:hypothetical protein